MARTRTWRRVRDARRSIATSSETAKLSELDALIKGTGWRRGWADRIKGTQIGIVYLMRDGVDECAIAQWPAYEGSGSSGTLIPRAAIAEARNLLDNPPAPRTRREEYDKGHAIPCRRQ